MYPRIVTDIVKLKHNIEVLKEMCKNNRITRLTLVVKALAGNMNILSNLADIDVDYLGDSRIRNLKKMKNLPQKKMLLRIPSDSELKDVLRYSDVSLQSELKTIKKLNEIAGHMKVTHNVLLMFDMGDLREGWFFQNEYMEDIKEIATLENIRIQGIGTNLTCYGGVLPSKENLTGLVEIADHIERELGIELDLISGGNSSTLAFFDKSMIPSRINHLRIGEGYLLGRETSFGQPIDNMFQDVFSLETKVIECKVKPSLPIGTTGLNSFGEVPSIPDTGPMRRAIVGIGKQDVMPSSLEPLNPKLRVVGGSSDHLILDASKTRLNVGSTVRFKMTYPGLVHLMNSPYVDKRIKK